MYLKRELSPSLTRYKGLRFASRYRQKSAHRYKTIVGVGGNVGDVRRRFEHLFHFLKKDKRVELIETSNILKNPPFGYVDQDDFLNCVIVLRVSMQPMVFLDYLMRLEKKFARKRSFANAPRTLDLDIIFFENRVIRTPRLSLPHPHWFERESVVIPLSEVSV